MQHVSFDQTGITINDDHITWDLPDGVVVYLENDANLNTSEPVELDLKKVRLETDWPYGWSFDYWDEDDEPNWVDNLFKCEECLELKFVALDKTPCTAPRLVATVHYNGKDRLCNGKDRPVKIKQEIYHVEDPVLTVGQLMKALEGIDPDTIVTIPDGNATKLEFDYDKLHITRRFCDCFEYDDPYED